MSILFDIRYAFRNLIRSSAFSVTTVIVMTIGLAASIYVLMVVKNFLLDPIYFPEGDRVVRITRLINDKPRGALFHDYQKLKEEASSFEIIAIHDAESTTLSDGVRSVRYTGAFVNDEFFALTGTEVILGRALQSEDFSVGSNAVVVISYAIWQNYFGGDRSIIGKRARINGKECEIVGVGSELSAYPRKSTLWLPLQINPMHLELSDSPFVLMSARLKPGISVAEAEKEVNAIFARSPDLIHDPSLRLTAKVMPYVLSYVFGSKKILYSLLVAGISILTLCSINVGNMLLARANGRMTETAIRLALGASRERLIMQTMMEATLVCLAGGVLGVLLAGWGLEITTQYFIGRFYYGGFPKWAELSLGFDGVILGAGVTVLTAVLTGFVPAWRASKCEFNEVLKDGSKTSLGKKSGLISRTIVGVQVSLSCCMLIVAGVLLIVLQQKYQQGYGVKIEQYVSGRVDALEEVYSSKESRIGFFDRLYNEIQKMPGVEKATLMSAVPTENANKFNVEPEGTEWARPDFPRINRVEVYPNTFDTLGMALLEGRLFDTRDVRKSQRVAIVSDALASRLWPGESAIGKRLRVYSNRKGDPNNWRTVVGVVPQIVQRDLFSSKRIPNLYLPYMQKGNESMAVVLKTQGDPAKYKNLLEQAVYNINPKIALYGFLPLNLQAKKNNFFRDFIQFVFVVFAVFALIMAATGIYGIMANHIRRRTQEIGIRRALGIPNRSIIWLFIKQSGVQLLAGFGVGIPLGYIAAEALISSFGAESRLYYVTFILVPMLISVVIYFATLIPLARSLRESPSAALRYS